MTKRYWLRSTLFNIAFYGVTALACIALLPTLLFPRNALLKIVHLWLHSVHFLERTIMGLRFEIRGLEHLPADGKSYIIAAKHQSAYETMKLHLLFGDPAIILKQELLKIPLWGWYVKKSDVIAIDRSSPEMAITSIQDGARRMQEQGRPIIIFPQGTRVKIEETSAAKPYKVGVARIQEAIGAPIIPLALNTGFFWPRKGWCKRPGTVIFEFMPPIDSGMERSELLSKLEETIENKSAALLEEAKFKENQRLDDSSIMPKILIGLGVILLAAYSALWWFVSDAVKREHSLFLAKAEQTDSIDENDVNTLTRATSGVIVSGFPGRIHADIASEYFTFPKGSLDIRDISAKSWPIPFTTVHIEIGMLSFQSIDYAQPFTFERVRAALIPYQDKVDIKFAVLERGATQIMAQGEIRKNTNGEIALDLVISLKNHEDFIRYMVDQGVIDERSELFISAGLKALEQDGVVNLQVVTRDNNLYAGPFLIGNIAAIMSRF